ncbi:MAG: hypothetical protein AAF604_15240 [Acidobacteriota bacterium]
MSKRFFWIAILMVAAALCSGGWLFAGAHGQDSHSPESVLAELDLNPEQMRQIHAIHGMVSSHWNGAHLHGQHLQALVRHAADGELSREEIRQTVDAGVEQMRQRGYALADEMTALLESLDSHQYTLLMEHLEKAATFMSQKHERGHH